MTSNINLTQLTAEQRAELARQAQELNREERKRLATDRKAYKECSEEFVHRNIDFWISHQSATEEAIKKLYQDFEALKNLKAAAYGEKVNDFDSHTSTLPDGSASLTIGYNVTISFDGTESAGVQKIKNFIASLADDSEKVQKLTKMVNTFLRPNVKTGMLNPAKIIELNKLRDEFASDEFNEGLDIIFAAQHRRQNSMYVSGWKYITLDGFPKKVTFRFTV